MPMINKKLKISIIALIISPSFCYANSPEELENIDAIPFSFHRYSTGNINAFQNSWHHHGSLNHREKNNTYTSKYSTVIINSINNKNTISFDSGTQFEPLILKNIDNVSFMSLSNDGIYAIGHGNDKEKNILRFFVYNTISKKINFLITKKIFLMMKKTIFSRQKMVVLVFMLNMMKATLS